MWRVAILVAIVGSVGLCLYLFGFADEFEVPENFPVLTPEEVGEKPPASGLELATFGSGCFWCTEAVFRNLKGVVKVVSGYSGGSLKNPTYAQVCSGETGHAEVVQVMFDPGVISYPELLEVFGGRTTRPRGTARATTRERSTAPSSSSIPIGKSSWPNATS